MPSNISGKTLPDINLSYGNRDTCILEVYIFNLIKLFIENKKSKCSYFFLDG